MHGGRTSDNSPFDVEDINRLIDMSAVKTPIKTIPVNKYYMLNMYEEIDVRIPIIIGVDVASGIGKDASSIVLINSKTKGIIGILRNTKMDTDDLSDAIYTIATTIARKCVICIERNNSGSTVISRLRKMPEIEPKLYRELNLDEMKQKMKDGYIVDNNVTAANYGIWTDGHKRAEMHDTLARFVKNYKDRIAASEIVEEIRALVFIKGRVDHQVGKHDDIVMGYLMGIWAYYYGNNIQNFGIARVPDPKPGLTEEEDLQLRANEALKKHKQSSLLGSAWDDEPGGKVVMTMQDFQREQELARLQFQDMVTPFNHNGDGVISMDNDQFVRVSAYGGASSGGSMFSNDDEDINFNKFV